MTKTRILLAVAVLACMGRAWGQSDSPATVQSGSLPDEVVIKGQDVGPKIGASKPPLNIRIDSFEVIRPSLEPDRSLFLAQSRLTTGWRHTHPDFLASPRVVEAWRNVFGGRSGMVFDLHRQLLDVLANPVSERDLKKYQWTLTIADEEGRLFQQYEGKKNPPEELFWNGQNERGQWIRPGHTYSPLYKFIDPSGSPYTRVGKPIQAASIARQEPSGLAIGLDSAVLFGPEKALTEPERSGLSLLHDSADFVKRNYNDVSILIRVFSSTKELAESQGEAVQTYLSRELMLPLKGITIQADIAPFREQRIEILLLNR